MYFFYSQICKIQQSLPLAPAHTGRTESSSEKTKQGLETMKQRRKTHTVSKVKKKNHQQTGWEAAL